MPRTISGEDPAELRAAFHALYRASTSADLGAVLRDHPVVRRPAFAALIRQDYLKIQKDQPAQFASFRAMYSDLFFALDREAHEARCARVPPHAADAPAAPEVTSQPLLPALHASILRHLGDRLPALGGPPLDPARDGDRLRNALATATGASVDLPRYEPTPGICWSIVGVVCASCGLSYIYPHCHAVDLVTTPNVENDVIAGHLDETGCPRCGERCARPAGVLLEDPPFAGDPLASLTCAWRLAPNIFVYQPPPGTVRTPDLDRILEIRFTLRLEDLGWLTDPTDTETGAESSSPIVRSMAVAYDWDELRRLLSQRDENGGVPRAMITAVREIAHKIRSGMLPVHQAEEQIARTFPIVGAQWPVIAPPPVQSTGEGLIEGFVQALIAEAVASGQQGIAARRPILATITMGYHLAMNEPAAAERAYARAEDLLAQVSATDSLRPIAETALRSAGGDLFDALGQHARAQALRSQSLPEGLLQRGSLNERIVAAANRERAALSDFQQGRLDEALMHYPTCLAELQALAAEIKGTTGEETAAFAELVRHNLNGATANYAAVLTEIADRIEAASAEQIAPNVVDAGSLRREAIALLTAALDEAEQHHYLDYASVQAHRLAVLWQQEGDNGAAAGFAERAIAHAKRCGDHLRAWTAGAFLAQHRLDARDGAGALARLQDVVLEWMRSAIGQGSHVKADPAVAVLGAGIVKAVDLGADPTCCALLLENLKATTTASALATGFPIRPNARDGTELSRQVDEAHRLREDLRLEAMWSPADQERRQQLDEADATLAALRTQLSLRSPAFAEWVDDSNLEISNADRFRRRLATLGARTRLLGCFATPDAVHTYLLGPTSTTFSSHDLPATRGSHALDAASLEQLADVFLTPFSAEIAALSPEDRLIISPDFGFFDLPFAALPIAGQPLALRVTPSVIQGAGVLEALVDRPRRGRTRLVAVGGPKRPDRTDLPGARAEVKAIHALFAGADPAQVARQATVPALMGSLANADVLHIACHADSSSDSRAQACLALAPAPHDHDSGLLSEDRIIAELDLPQGCFVNLAGCATGSQIGRDGPILGGLVPAFLVAGAGAVLASVRPIEDGEATAFQRGFYERFIGTGSPARSLVECQRACLRGELGPEMSSPRAWAFYVVYGVN